MFLYIIHFLLAALWARVKWEHLKSAKFGTLSSKWAMGRRQTSIVSEKLIFTFFEEGLTKNCKKRVFFAFRQITWDFDIETHIQGTTMLKLTSRRFRKCGSFWAYDDFCASYYRSKSAHDGKSESVTIIMRCPKKKTRQQFWVLSAAIESAWNQPCWANAVSMARPKTQNCGRVFFFWRLLSLEFFLQFSPNFDGQ